MPQELEQSIDTVNEFSVLEARLRFGEPSEREAAANLLAGEGVRAIPVLIDALKHDTERFVQLAAVTSLCRIDGAPSDAQRLPEAMGHDCGFMVQVVAARWRHGTAFPFLLHRIESADPQEVCSAVRAVVRLLGHQKSHTSEAVELKGCLAKALRNRHREVRLEAVRAMSRVDHPDVLSALTPYISRLASRSRRRIVIGGLAAILGALLLGFGANLFDLSSEAILGMIVLLLFGGVLALLIGGVRMLIQEVSGSRLELEQALMACAAQNPGRVAGIRRELQQIASPFAGQTSTSQFQAREMLQQVRTHELMRGSLPIAASLPEPSFEELPTPAAAPEASAETAVNTKV